MSFCVTVDVELPHEVVESTPSIKEAVADALTLHAAALRLAAHEGRRDFRRRGVGDDASGEQELPHGVIVRWRSGWKPTA